MCLWNSLKFMLASMLCIGLVGCGNGERSLTGTVTVDNQPIDDGMIVFAPSGEGDKRQKVAVQIINGKYVVESAKGLTDGKYRVEITWMKKTGKKVPTGDGAEMRDESVQSLPAKFNTSSMLMADIPAPSNQLDFPLSLK